MRLPGRVAPTVFVLCWVSLLGVAACGGATPRVAAAPPGAGDPLEGLDELVPEVMDAWEVPGLSIAVVHDGAVVLSRGYGLRELGTDQTVDDGTVFAIASNTKPFVATVVAMLVAEGSIAWDDRVLTHLPGLRLHDELATREMRVVDLLAHRSGLATFAGDLMWIGSRLETDEVLARLRHVEPASSFRLQYGYSNMMFVAAGEVVRARTGQGWDEAVRSRLIEPLGMTRTTTSVADLEGMDNVAVPYMPYDGELVAVPYLDMDSCGAAGGLNSTAADMARWIQLQLGEGSFGGRQVVPPEVVAALRVPQTPIPLSPSSGELFPSRHFLAYGLGWFLYDYRGRLVVTHGGGLPGMTSVVALVPEEDLGVVILTNSESSAPRVVLMHLLDRYLGGSGEVDWHAALLARYREGEEARLAEEAAARAEIEALGDATLPLSGFSGRYASPMLGSAEVEARGEGGLHLRVVGHGGLDCPLEHLGGDTFLCTWSNRTFLRSNVRFDVEEGAAVRLRFRVRPEFVDPLEYVFERGGAELEPGPAEEVGVRVLEGLQLRAGKMRSSVGEMARRTP